MTLQAPSSVPAALSEYLESALAGKPVSPVALFPQYRDVQSLTGVERVHPADLWPVERRFREPDVALPATAVPYDAAARARLDHAVLRIVKDGDFRAARDLRDLSGRPQGRRIARCVPSGRFGAGYFGVSPVAWLAPMVPSAWPPAS